MKKNFKRTVASDIKSGLKMRIYLASVREVDMETFPEATAGSIATSPLGEAGKWMYVDVDTLVPACKPGGVVYNGQKSITCLCDGLNPERLDWIYANVGEKFIVVYEDLISKRKVIAGGPLGGLTLTYEDLGVIEGKNGVSFKLEGPENPTPFYYYEGTLTVIADPV